MSNNAQRHRASAAPIVPLERRIAYRCLLVNTRITRLLAPMWQEIYGLSVINWRVMAVIGRYAPVAAKDVVARTSTDPFFVSRAVEQLCAQGFVRREVDPLDRRRWRLELTAQGHAAHRAIEASISRAEAALAEGLSQAERRALDSALAHLDERSKALAERHTWREFA